MKLAIFVVLTLLAVIQATPDCTSYCTNITGSCTGVLAQYTNMAHCMAMCGAWPVGTDNDTSGNTLGCRAYHSGAVATLGTDHCYHAGPYGADLKSNASICGTQCEAYCSIMLYKPGCNDTLRAFNSMAECVNACPLFVSDMSKYYDNATGNTLQCRIYHAKVAFSGGQTTLNTHCQHAAPLGGGQCGDPVQTYCQILNGLCSGGNSQISAATAGQYCLDVAKNFPYNKSDNFNDYDGNTLACRAYHAVVGGPVHCPHAGISGNGTGGCGTSVCESYCILSAKACPSNYANTAACTTACNAWTTKIGAVSDQSGDTFYCRLYHLGAAAAGGAAATTHCPHALDKSATCGSTVPNPSPNPSGSAVVLGFSVLALIANLF